MESDILRKLDMGKRSHRCILEYPITPPAVRATEATADLATAITNIELAAQKQTGGGGEAEGGVDLRAVTAKALRNYLKDLNRTARTLEKDYPGISPIFRLPRSGSYPALKATADSVLPKATELQSAFVDAGLPATFLTELAALVTAFEDALKQKQDGGILRKSGTAGLKVYARHLLDAATRLDACVRNHFRNNPVVLETWAHARRIESAPRSNAEAPAAPAPASTAGQPA